MRRTEAVDRKKEFNFDTLLGFFSIITAGAICMLLLFCGYTQQDEQKALSSAEETLQFLKTSCLRCERYNVEGKSTYTFKAKRGNGKTVFNG